MTFWKPFLTGAIASAATVLLVQRLSSKQRQESRHRSRRALDTTTCTRTVDQSSTEQAATAPLTLMDSDQLEMRMIRKAEGAIQKRTSRVTVVVERCTNDHNYSAILRTAEALGIQNIFIVCPTTIRDEDDTTLTSMKGTKVNQGQHEKETRKLHHLYAQRATEWLTVREFDSTTECLKELRATGHTVWATDLSQAALCLTEEELRAVQQQQQGIPSSSTSSVLPPKLAIVFGTEAVGCTQEMLDGADLRVYLPLRGFADSLNLSVATALVVHHLFLLDPSIEGDMSEEERHELRELWFPRLAKKRLESSRQKKTRVKLQGRLKKVEEMERKKNSGQDMLKEQLDIIGGLPALREELQDMDEKIEQQAHDAVADLIENPPAPITDMRRADEHRTCFVGKNTKNKYEEVWNNMPATTNYKTATGRSSAEFFRSRAENVSTNGKASTDNRS